MVSVMKIVGSKARSFMFASKEAAEACIRDDFVRERRKAEAAGARFAETLRLPDLSKAALCVEGRTETGETVKKETTWILSESVAFDTYQVRERSSLDEDTHVERFFEKDAAYEHYNAAVRKEAAECSAGVSGNGQEAIITISDGEKNDEN